MVVEDNSDEDEDDNEEQLAFKLHFVFLRLPLPTGMFRRAPTLVFQYLRQYLQKWCGVTLLTREREKRQCCEGRGKERRWWKGEGGGVVLQWQGGWRWRR
ncbi:hypothetical protein CsSME_00015883 [Camellia sinensis var. sinensis]